MKNFIAVAGLSMIALCSGGCAGSNPDPSAVAVSELAPEAKALVGKWNCSATQIETCPTGSHADNLYGQIEIFPGRDASSVDTTVITPVADTSTGTILPNDPSVELRWTVSAGAVALLDGTQTLPAEPGSEGGTWTPTFATGTGTLTGTTMVWTESGSALFVDGVAVTCSFTLTATCTPQ